ncbi:hypothetical protein GOBAR_AA27758 [Gossypium barbadense]|uniref:Piwi domain-containing protein n=1 Tax=Gossypium barbadense TaxID=3634 RepID=A0A2P5WPB0_GOSBA|nr:hypothetical protein GOBAR_AA27758 [Gossypium barbadense]
MPKVCSLFKDNAPYHSTQYNKVVSKVPTIILGMGALFGFPEQSDVPSMILSSKPVFDKVDDGIMKEALLDFYTSSGKRKPNQIIIFRDGVSEFQFNQVLIKLSGLQGSPDNVLHGIVIDNKLHSWGQFMKIRDASETSSSHGGMYAPRGLTNNSRTTAGAISFSWVYESRFFLQALMESRIEYLYQDELHLT